MNPPARARLVFMGTADLARIVLRELAGSREYEVVLVVAQPDKPVGRGLGVKAPPVKEEALARGLPLLQPFRARDPVFIEELRRLAPDLIVVAAYGQLLPPAILEIPRRGCVNVHTSLLPRWRGAAPIPWALLEGDTETGVTLMRMDAGLDTGDIIACESTLISDRDTGQTLHDRLAMMGADLLLRTLPSWLDGRLPARPQPAQGVTHARKLTREDGRLDWTQPAERLWRRVRALVPWPGAFTTFLDADRRPVLLKIWEAEAVAGHGAPGEVLRGDADQLVIAAGQGALRIDCLQREGRKRLATREFLKSGLLKPGDKVGILPETSEPVRE